MQNNYFKLFGLEPGIDLDLSGLNKKYLSLQAEYHPDKFVGKSAADKNAALEKSSQINKAYSVLKDRLKRAEYVLGVKPLAKEKLMEIMEMFESSDPAAAEKARRQVGDLFNQIIIDYSAGKKDTAAEKLAEIKYLNRYLEDAAADT